MGLGEVAAILDPETMTSGQRETRLKATTICGEGVRGHQTTTDVAIRTETEKAIDRLNTTVGAEAETEAPRNQIGRHFTEDPQVKR